MGRRSLAAERRDAVLEAYEGCILDRGFAATTLSDVAERAGVKRQILRHYFGNRGAVVRALIARLASRVDRRFEGRITGSTREAVVDSFLDSLSVAAEGTDEVRDDRLFGELFGAGMSDPVVREELSATTARWRSELVELFRWLAPSAPEVELERAATLALCLNLGLGTIGQLELDAAAPTWVRAALEQIVASLGTTHDGGASSAP